MLIIAGSESGKTNMLLNTDKYQQPEIEKFIHQRSIQIKVSIPYKQKRKIKNSRIRKFKCIC